MAAGRMNRALLPTVSAVLGTLAFDPELQAIAARACPSEASQRRTELELERENERRRRMLVRDLREMTWRAVDGVFGGKVRDGAREIVADGSMVERSRREWAVLVRDTSEAHLGRVRQLVWEWRRAGRAKKGKKR